MPRKYKVFYHDTAIILCERPDGLADLQGNSLTLGFDDKDDLSDAISLAEDHDTLNSIVIHHPDLNALWEAFSAQFKLVEAAGGLVKNENGDYLIMLRRSAWDLPKGKIDKGESHQEAALREVEEECGLDELSIGAALPTTYHIYPEKAGLVLKPTYWFEMTASSSASLVPQAEEQIEKLEWVDESELKKRLGNSFRTLHEWIEEVIA